MRDRDLGFARLVAAKPGVKAEQQRRVPRDVASHQFRGEAYAREAGPDLAQLERIPEVERPVAE